MSRIFISDMPNVGWRWGYMKHRLVQWRRRAQARHELRGLSDSTLRDLGLTRCDAASESTKPFWMA
ncbi:MAG: DUF1127 domain-containing protein [Xanthobacteraceae bacterium]